MEPQIISQRPFGSSKKIHLVDMTPMETLLNAIDNARPIHLPNPNNSNNSNKRNRPSSPQQTMSLEHLLHEDDSIRQSKRMCCSPVSPPPQYNEEIILNQKYQPCKITIFHASIAQKSYGSEKRFLCPPPIVQMSDTKTKPLVSMSVMGESNNNTSASQLEQRTLLEKDMSCSFKYLFVTGTAKAKQFRLRVNLSHQQQVQPCASFFSNPISIISKPSKKTAKARNISTCLFNNSFISLYNRINSQTVRTKYLTTESKRMCAKNSSWSPFEVVVVGQPNQSINSESQSMGVPITYGTEIVLKDLNTGVASPPLTICKVDKGQIIQNANGLLSQMQKIALQLSSTANSSRPMYLDANGASMNMQDPDPHTNLVNHNSNAWVDFTCSKVEDDIETINDYHCWTIVGISRYQQTFPENQLSQYANTMATMDTTKNNIMDMPYHHHNSTRQLSPPLSPPRTIIPFPVIDTVEYLPHQHSLRIVGQNLTQPHNNKSLEFYIGQPQQQSLQVVTAQENNNSLTVLMPETQALLVTNHDQLISRQDGSRYLELALLLKRQQDGLVYHSNKTLIYDIDSDCNYGKWSVNDCSSSSSVSTTSSLV